MEATDRIRHYYAQNDEWGRLERPPGRLEFEETLDLLGRYLKPNSRILDLGAGPGRYAIAMCQRGHRVRVADISPHQLDVARERIREAGVQNQVEAVELLEGSELTPFADEMFDAVLALGPFYHLTEATERQRMASEVCRVLCPSGVAAVAFMPRLSGIAGFLEKAVKDHEQVTVENLRQTYAQGVFHNATMRGFQEGYFADAKEIAELFAAVGIESAEVRSVQGIAFGREHYLFDLEQCHPAVYDEFRRLVRATASDPDVVRLGGHAVYVGIKTFSCPPRPLR